MRPLLIVLVDAFSNYYLSPKDTPFLYSIASYYYRIEPLFAYRGIEASIFTGRSPNTHKVWSEFRLRTAKDRWIRAWVSKNIAKIANIIPSSKLRQMSRYILQGYLQGVVATPNLIPADMLTLFEASKPIHITRERSVGQIPTLYDILREENLNFVHMEPKAGDGYVVKKALRGIERQYHDFWFIKLGNLDKVGHKFGPHSDELRRELKKTDSRIERIIHAFEKEYRDPVFIILSDHGMVEVRGIVNMDFIRPKRHDDYLVFLDSTMARFWFHDQRIKTRVQEKLSTLNSGFLLSPSDLKRLNIDSIGNEYGELIFALKEGLVIFPDFWRDAHPPKGMHGYAFSTNDVPMLLIYAPDRRVKFKQIEAVEFTDIMPTILDLLNISIPDTCEGISLYQGKYMKN